MMPRMDGIEAAKIIRSLGYLNPIVALTANAIAGQASMFIENGFDDFISKPIDIRQLNMALNKLVRDRHPPEEVEAARQKKELSFLEAQEKQPEPQLAEIFARDAKKALTELQAIYLNRCRRENDLSMFVITIHAMKSALANITKAALSADAAKLEEAGREKNIELIMHELPLFMEKLQSVIEKLTPAEDSKDADDITDYQYLKENLLVIKEACASLDKKTARDTLAEIKKKSWPAPVNEKLSDISEHLLHSDFNEVVQVIDHYVQNLKIIP